MHCDQDPCLVKNIILHTMYWRRQHDTVENDLCDHQFPQYSLRDDPLRATFLKQQQQPDDEELTAKDRCQPAASGPVAMLSRIIHTLLTDSKTMDAGDIRPQLCKDSNARTRLFVVIYSYSVGRCIRRRHFSDLASQSKELQTMMAMTPIKIATDLDCLALFPIHQA